MPTLQQNDVFADRYRLKDLLGTHGISEVWLAEDQQESREMVAVKVYAPQFRLEEQVLNQLREDYVRINELDHPHLLQFHHFDQHQGMPYLVLPYMENGSLAQRLYDKGPLTAYEIALLLKQAGSALHYLHTQQPPVLHQSIKPENILIAEDESYLLADFGISNRTRILLRKATGLDTSLPAAYAAPEFFAAQPVKNAASDIFALGVTLYELCTGEVPWQGNGGLALLQGAEVPYLPGSYDRVLSNIVRVCLDPNWEKRPTAAELEAEATYFLENGKWKTYGRFGIVTANVIEYKRTPWYKYALAGIAALLVLLAAGYFYYTRYYLPGKTGKPAENKVITVLPNKPDEPKESQSTGSTATPPPTEPIAQKRSPETTSTKPPAPPKKEAVTTPATETYKSAVATQKPALTKPAFAKPRTLRAFLAQMVDEKVPIEVREKWKPDMLKLFAPGAAVYYAEGSEAVSRFSAGEFADILLSADSTSTVTIDSTQEDDSGKIKELYVRMMAGD
ncbi:serine/threonine protein kinase [Pontibacter ruber]|uniref:non-specific serine/threonine protein kinase n=1 Tax=Pontibacter ruber TaxID=1343895 RepID=A0ABW5CYB4_9BACT|nr:serine/threonine protein kinase [Pontibacter ruber]